MKKNIVRRQSIIFMLALAAASMLAGCQKTDETRRENSNPSTSAGTTMSAGRDNSTGNAGTKAEEAGEELTGASALEVRFGDDGAPFVMQMEDNATADAIAGYVGTANWRLPIYHYDDYENWEVMQYYDIPTMRYPLSQKWLPQKKRVRYIIRSLTVLSCFTRTGKLPGNTQRLGPLKTPGSSGKQWRAIRYWRVGATRLS